MRNSLGTVLGVFLGVVAAGFLLGLNVVHFLIIRALVAWMGL